MLEASAFFHPITLHHSAMTIKQRYQGIIDWFQANMPTAQTELHYNSPYQLLVAVILSAQCTDKRINMITPALFEAFPTPGDMARSSVEEIYDYVKSVSYPNNKAKNLFAMANMLVDVYHSTVPDTMEDLIKLPGVGRKTANVILSVVFDQARMAVDTHVFRVSERIGLTTNSRTPLETERTLIAHLPTEVLARAHHWLILHGRYTCTARKPKCMECGIKDFCRYYSKNAK